MTLSDCAKMFDLNLLRLRRPGLTAQRVGARSALFVGGALCLSAMAPLAAHAQGAALAERLLLCGSCHGADGNSSVPENPNLAGLDASYLQRQLRSFKDGKRKSPTMNAILGAVDAKEFEALAQHFSEQKNKAAKPAIAKTDKKLARGKEIFDEGITAAAVPACSGCHNEDGSGTDKYPRIAGQHPSYVMQQLRNFKSGERDNDERGVMRAVAKRMDDAQIQAVAEYIQILRVEE